MNLSKLVTYKQKKVVKEYHFEWNSQHCEVRVDNMIRIRQGDKHIEFPLIAAEKIRHILEETPDH